MAGDIYRMSLILIMFGYTGTVFAAGNMQNDLYTRMDEEFVMTEERSETTYDTPEGNICSECWGMRKIATCYIAPVTQIRDTFRCIHCKGTGIEPEKWQAGGWQWRAEDTPTIGAFGEWWFCEAGSDARLLEYEKGGGI